MNKILDNLTFHKNATEMDILNRLTVTFLLITSFCFCHLNAQNTKVKFTISHCNDISGVIVPFELGIEDFSITPEECIQKADHNCTGGFVNVVHWLHANKTDGFEKLPKNNLILSTGNFIGGETGWISADWFGTNGWEEFGGLIKKYLAPTFMSLGVREFDNGLKQTTEYLKKLGGNASVLLGNTCGQSYREDTAEYLLCQNLEANFKTFELTMPDNVNKYPLGIIGFIRPDVKQLSMPGKLEFSDVVETIRDKVTHSDAKDIKTFIAIGDGSLDLAKQIIDQVEKVKLVIYGAAFSATKIDQYPLPYNSGFIATAGRYGSSVGKMVLEIDTETGSISSVSGTQKVTDPPPELNKEASGASDATNTWTGTVRQLQKDQLGCTTVNLVGGKDTCWGGECNIGNIMADAMVNCVLKKTYTNPFPYPLHSIWHSGSFSDNILEGPGKIFQFYLHKLYPYHNGIHLVKVKGSDLKQVFQKGVSGIDRGQFLQVSNGLEVHYDTTSVEPKVTKVRIVQDDYGVPRLGDIKDDEEYYFVISAYIREGRGLFNFEKEIWEDIKNKTDNLFDDVCLEEYFKTSKYTSVGVEERIWINGENGGGPDGHSLCHNDGKTAVTVILTIVYFAIFLGVVYIGYFYVIPRLRRPAIPIEVLYPPNQS